MKNKIEKIINNLLLREISNTNLVGFIALLMLIISYTWNTFWRQDMFLKSNILENNKKISNQFLVKIDWIDYIMTRK